MFSLAKVFAAAVTITSFAHATITISQPNIKGNSTNTISWSFTDLNTDPVLFSIELNNQIFNKEFAIANNVPTTQGSATFEWPVVAPSSTYTISFVDIGNVNNVIATSPPFVVQENDVGTSAVGTAPSTSGTASATTLSSVSSVASSTSALSSSVGTLTQTRPVTSSTQASSLSGLSSAATISSAVTPTLASASAASASASHSAAKELIPSGSFAALIAGVLALLF